MSDPTPARSTDPGHGGESPGRASAGQEHLLNPDFDLSLRPRWRGRPAGRARQVDELALHGLLVGGAGASVLVPWPVPEDFLAHLREARVSHAEPTELPAIRRHARFTPYGWNRRAVELNQRYLTPTPHPPLAVVEEVNDRRFAASLEEEICSRAWTLGTFSRLDDLRDHLRRHRPPAAGWVVKATHGNAALGNRRLRGAGLDRADERFVRSLLDEDHGVVVEPWLDRCLDLCVTFTVTAEGSLAGLHLHEVVNTADGAFIGAVFEPDPKPLEPWREALESAADTIARRLHQRGYFGPVCVDALVHGDDGGRRLRPLVDLNARSHASVGALRLWRDHLDNRCVYWRFFTSAKLRLPDDCAALRRALGPDAYTPSKGRGVLLTSPLGYRAGDGWRRPHKLSFALVADSRDGAFGLERAFRDRFER